MNGMLAGASRPVGRTVAVAVVGALLVILAMEALGDPIAARLPADAPPDQVAFLRRQPGLDRTFGERLLNRLAEAAVGGFGTSYATGEPAGGLVRARLPATFALVGTGAVVGVGGGLLLGLLTFGCRGRRVGAPLRCIVLGLQAVPVFVVAIVAVRVFASELRVLPPSGSGDLATLVLPAGVLGLDLALGLAVFLDAGLVEAAAAPFATVAVAKGLRPIQIGLGHLVPAALPSFGSYVGLRLARLAGGALLVEEIFAYNGIGQLALFALRHRDLPLVLACTVAVVLLVGGVRVLADVLAPALDPRLRGGT